VDSHLGTDSSPRHGVGSVTTCASCGAEIIWCRTDTGKRMPVDAHPATDGNFILDGDPQLPTARSVARVDSEPGQPLHRSHFATCPHADRYRRTTVLGPDRPAPHQHLFGE